MQKEFPVRKIHFKLQMKMLNLCTNRKLNSECLLIIKFLVCYFFFRFSAATAIHPGVENIMHLCGDPRLLVPLGVENLLEGNHNFFFCEIEMPEQNYCTFSNISIVNFVEHWIRSIASISNFDLYPMLPMLLKKWTKKNKGTRTPAEWTHSKFHNFIFHFTLNHWSTVTWRSSF